MLNDAVIPAAAKADLQTQLQALVRRVVEEAKKAAAGNKALAVATAVEKADAAVALGQKFAVMRIDVGLDSKALLEAVTAIQKKHDALPVMMFSVDPSGEWVIVLPRCAGALDAAAAILSSK